jgi:hypothetical protein
MRTHRFGRKIKLPATIAIKHQIRMRMAQYEVKKAEADRLLRRSLPRATSVRRNPALGRKEEPCSSDRSRRAPVEGIWPPDATRISEQFYTDIA